MERTQGVLQAPDSEAAQKQNVTETVEQTSVARDDAEGQDALLRTNGDMESPNEIGASCTSACAEYGVLALDGNTDVHLRNLGNVYLEGTGRILDLSMTLKSVRPGKRTSVAVLLYELDAQNQRHARGLKTFVVPAHTQSGCRDITVRCVRFVLPESLSTGTGDCATRRLVARVAAHAVDTAYTCD